VRNVKVRTKNGLVLGMEGHARQIRTKNGGVLGMEGIGMQGQTVVALQGFNGLLGLKISSLSSSSSGFPSRGEVG